MCVSLPLHLAGSVTTSSIRSRILKAVRAWRRYIPECGHNIVDPFEDTESVMLSYALGKLRCHNIVDPFEDTESSATGAAG